MCWPWHMGKHWKTMQHIGWWSSFTRGGWTTKQENHGWPTVFFWVSKIIWDICCFSSLHLIVGKPIRRDTRWYIHPVPGLPWKVAEDVWLRRLKMWMGHSPLKNPPRNQHQPWCKRSFFFTVKKRRSISIGFIGLKTSSFWMRKSPYVVLRKGRGSCAKNRLDQGFETLHWTKPSRSSAQGTGSYRVKC